MINEHAYLRLIGEASVITYVLFFKKRNKKHIDLIQKAFCFSKNFTA